MEISKFILAILCAVQCISCQSKDIESRNSEESNIDSVAGEFEAADNIVTVSPMAEENFLNPLEAYSWELTEKPEYVMLHFTSAVVLSRDDPYNMNTVRKIFEDNGVSIHYIVDRDGNIYCYLPETRAAWHAGVGTLANDQKYTNSMNKYSIGIEILAIGSKNDMAQYLTSDEYDALDKSLIGYTDAQYESLCLLVRDICERNGIPFDREYVIGHDMYNPSKSDPGELFDWDRLFFEKQ